MKEHIANLRKWFGANSNGFSYRQLQRMENIIRDLVDLEYDVSKANDGICGGEKAISPMQQMSAVSGEQEK